MKYLLTILAMLLVYSTAFCQPDSIFLYEPSVSNPFGMLNPSAPEAVGDYDQMIGICDCKRVVRGSDGAWSKDTTLMTWKFKYIMNGTAVQDEVWRENGHYAGGIRQYQPDSAKWVVSYFSNPGISISSRVWLGTKADKDIVVYKDQTAANGMKGDSRLTFHDISDRGFNWTGEWVSKDGSTVFPFWKIFCTKREF